MPAHSRQSATDRDHLTRCPQRSSQHGHFAFRSCSPTSSKNLTTSCPSTKNRLLKRAQRTHSIPNRQPVNFIDHRRPDARLCISRDQIIFFRPNAVLEADWQNSGHRFPDKVAWRWSPWTSDEVISLAGVDTEFKFTKHGRCELKSNRPGAFTEMHFHGLRRALSAWRPTIGYSGKSSRSSDIEQEVTNVTVLHHV